MPKQILNIDTTGPLFNHPISGELIAEAVELLFPASHFCITEQEIDGARVVFRPETNSIAIFGRRPAFIPADELVSFMLEEDFAAAAALPAAHDGSEFSAWFICRTVQHIVRSAASNWATYAKYAFPNQQFA